MQDALTQAVKVLVENEELHSVDAVLGRYLARLPAWTSDHGRAALRMVSKYVARLRGYGITAADLQGVMGFDSELRREAGGAMEGMALLETSERVIGVEAGVFTVRFPLDRALLEAVRLLPSAHWNERAGFWGVPMTLAGAERLFEFAPLYGFVISPEVFEAIDAMTDAAAGAAAASRAETAEYRVDGVRKPLRPYQQAGVRYGVEVAQGRLMLCDEMGLGKTLEALAIVKQKEAWPCLVICPASLKYNWKKEATEGLGIWAGVFDDCERQAMFRPKKKAKGQLEVIKPTEYSTRVEDFVRGEMVIINYDVVAKEKVLEVLKAVKWASVILDESHYLKDGKAQRTQAVKKIVRGVPVRLALTGTPVVNQVSDLISQLAVIGKLEALGGFWHFAERYCGAKKVQFSRGKFGWDLSGRTNISELHERMRATCFLRRRKKDVLAELPPKVRATVPVELDNWTEYRRAEEDVVQWLAGRAAAEKEFLMSVAHLPETQRMARIEARHTEKAEQLAACEALVRFEALKQLSVKGKMAAAKEWVENFLQSGEKLVLFAEHVEAVREMGTHFKADCLMGETPAKSRQEMVERFQNDPECRLLVCNLKAGGVGITLTAASNCAFLELGWTAAVMDQAEDRTHRFGQRRSVTCWYLMGKQTIDWTIFGIIRGKRNLTNAAVDGEGDAEAGRGQTMRDLAREFLQPRML